MTDDSANPEPAQVTDLRRRAEAAFGETPARMEIMPAEETSRLLHELRVHQIELEMQNEELRRTQVELDAARARYFDLYDLAPVGYCTVNERGIMVEANLTAATLLGQARNTLTRQPFSRFIHRDDQDDWYLRLKELSDTGEPQVCEARMLAGNGSVFWAHLEVNTSIESHGAPLRRIVIHDITARKQVEMKLRESEERYRSLFECSSDALVLAAPDGRIFTANPEACAVFGRSEQDLCRLGCQRLVDPDDPHAQDLLDRHVRTGRVRGELTLLRSDGTRFPAEVSSSGYRDRDGNARICVAIRDITDRKRAENALRESEARLNEAERMAHVGSLSWDVETDRMNWSEELYRIAGRDPDTAPLRHAQDSEIYTVESRERLDAAIKNALATGEPYDLELDVVRPDGRLRRTRARGATSRDGRGRITRVFGSLQDVTEQKQAEADKANLQAQLAQSQKMESIGRLAGGVAHDFNNLLTVINGYAGFLSQELPGGNPLREYALEISEAGERAASLTSQLLAFGRKQVINLTAVNLNAVVIEAERMLHRVIGDDIELVTTLASHVGAALADAGQILRVIVNLTANARDAMPDGGRIEISTAEVAFDDAAAALHPEGKAGRFVRLTVADNGSGMTEEVRQKIFEPFFTTKDKGKGTGLGLSIVYGILRQTGGWIEVESEPGKGSSFAIYLPHAGASVVEETTRRAGTDTSRGEATVLLVEDQPAVRRLTKAILQGRGYCVLEAGNGAEALALAGQHEGSIDLLLTDLVMPGINGRVLSEQLRAQRPGIRVILMSGYAQDILTGSNATAFSYIQKPYVPDDLTKMIHEVLSA